MAWPEILLRLSVAAIIGVAIGLDRELLHKSAGMRTIGLVSLGAALATMLIGPGDAAASSRVIQGVLTGIGFLGAGVIVHHKTSVDGLTTAASIWTAAVLGAGAGVAAWPVVVIGATLTLVLLILARVLERRLLR
jgi:putative Mg2+ transporter-C (MgtC) family protein